MKTIKLKDLEKTISGITEFVNEFKKSILHKQVKEIKFKHSKFSSLEISAAIDYYSSLDDDLYLYDIGFKLVEGNKKLDISCYVIDNLFETLNCEDEQAIVDIKNQYKEIYELINEFEQTNGFSIVHEYDNLEKESTLDIYIDTNAPKPIYSIKIKGQKITVDDATEEVRDSKIATLNNLRERVAQLEHELGYDVDEETWSDEEWNDDEDEEDEDDGFDEDWDDKD